MRLLVLILVFLFPIPAFGQTVCGPQNYNIEDEPNFECPMPGEESMVPRLTSPPSVPVHLGDSVIAEWEGALVHRDRLIRMGLRIQGIRRLHWADRLRLRAEYDIRIEHRDEVCDARTERVQERVEIYQEALELANEQTRSASAWYRSWWFGFVLGVVSAGALVALTAYALLAI